MFARKNKKTGEDHVEVNLIPFIDLLSVCICFLLLTAVWVQTEVISTKQALGTEAQTPDKTKTLWVELDSNDSAVISFDGKGGKQTMSLEALNDYAAQIRKQYPEMKTALVLPSIQTNYEKLVKAMNSLKKAEFTNVGISPL